jgi:hypothetical protein
VNPRRALVRLAAGVVLVVAAGACSGSSSTTAPTEWALVSITDGSALSIVSRSGGCTSFDHLVTKETDSTVTITTFNGTHHENPCPANVRLDISGVSLEAPLGNRELKGCSLDSRDGLRSTYGLHDDCTTINSKVTQGSSGTGTDGTGSPGPGSSGHANPD